MGRSGRPRIHYVELHLSAVKLTLMGRQRPASFPRTVWASFFPLPPPLDPGLKDGARGPYLKVLPLGRFQPYGRRQRQQGKFKT